MNLDIDLDDFPTFGGGANPSAFSSPANPAMDLSGSVHGSNIGTVSPQDMWLESPFMSAPNSTALTALTSPSIFDESPDMYGLDVSPNFGQEEIDGDMWPSLFPDSTGVQSTPAPAQVTAPDTTDSVEQSPVSQSDEIDVAELVEKTRRRKSSAARSPGSGRHSSVAGVGSRRQGKPLPPIVVKDPSDSAALKRAKNTLAARKSRQRKAERVEELEEQIRKLEAERDHWKKLATGGNAS